MDYVSSQRAAGMLLANGFSTLISTIKTALDRRAVFVRTRNELNALSDRELADLGISRVDITVISREAAYGI
jgi:uncharacterized protein YjiS (DUF1127 family)